jgi:hypothetical protein
MVLVDRPAKMAMSAAVTRGRSRFSFSRRRSLPPPAQDFRHGADLVNGIAATTPGGSAELVSQAAKEEKRREGGRKEL